MKGSRRRWAFVRGTRRKILATHPAGGARGLPPQILIDGGNVGPMTKLPSTGIKNSPTTLEDVL